MTRIALPANPDREALLAFWFAVIVVAGSILLALALLAGVSIVAVLPGIAAAAALWLALGIARERFIARLYKHFNGAAIAYATLASTMIVRIWYRTVVAVVARLEGEGALDLQGSEWLPRRTLDASGYGDPGGTGRHADGLGGWPDLARWALRSGRLWVLVLLPLLVMTRVLETRRRQAVATDVYTLY